MYNFRVRQEFGALSNRVGLQSQAGPRLEHRPSRTEFMAPKNRRNRQEWKSVQPEVIRAAAESPGDALQDIIPASRKPDGLAKVAPGKPVRTAKPASSPAINKQPAHVPSSPRSVWVAKSPGPTVLPPTSVQSHTPQQVAPSTKIAEKLSKAETDKQAPKAGGSKSTTVAQAHLRATFYPKFENEKSDQEVRSRIIEMVSAGYGVLEVSLKHSGSLFMYSGVKGGAYAKNSYGNLYTATGVFVLGRTLQEAWGLHAAQKQREFNKFLEDNRICVAMELVTAVLGDHGQRPLKDYVVVTAVTDLSGQPRFYPTPEVVAFCRQWRLPSNHFWLFSSKKSVTAFFTAYDALCEEGLASTVTHTLDEISDISIPATRSHQEVQGEILEGLVARIISPESSLHMSSTIKQFALPSLPSSPAPGLGLREVCAANKSSEKEQMKAIISAVGPNFCPDLSEWLGDDTVTVQSVKKADTPALSSFLQATPVDNVTAKVQEMIRLLRKKNMHVRFKCRLHSAHDEAAVEGGFRLTVHVLADSVFRKYQNEMKHQPHLWPLYRGFFLDVTYLKSDSTKLHAGQDGALKATKASEGLDIKDVEQTGSAENLMLKLKFLPYKLRTFLIRNGLSTLYNTGKAAYREYYMKQMKNWGTSLEKRRDLDQLLSEWATYITTKTKGKPLSSDTYLSEAEPFLERFARRSARNQQLVGSAGTLINVEDFIAGGRSLDNGSHMEFEEFEENTPPHLTSVEPTERIKAKGILVFFPGIPGCAKSALCKHVLSLPNGLGDGRKVVTLMGDLIKGRYWQRLAADQKKQPSVVMLADKNAPNEEVWKQIESICQTTRALGVPVVSDSNGTSSNPYSVDDLVIFMYRVLQRVNHPGNLDRNSPTPGYVLLMFHSLYEGTDREEFEAALKKKYGYLVKLPLLKNNRAQMPDEVLQVMKDGFSLFKRHKAKHGRTDALQGSFKNEWVEWEKRLKDVLFTNSTYLDAIQVPFQEVADSLVGQLKNIATGDNYMHVAAAEEERNFNNVTYVAISLPHEEVLAALKDVAQSNSVVQNYIADKIVEKGIPAAHVTLAHKRAHGVAAVASYGEVQGARVPIQLTAILFSEKLCAFEAQWESAPDQAILSRNSWPHVTLWTDKGTAAKEANSLPRLAEAGEASRFVLQTPKTVIGEVQFL